MRRQSHSPGPTVGAIRRWTARAEYAGSGCGCASTTTTTARGSPTARPGPVRALALLHSLGLSHREWEPIVGAAVDALPRRAARPAAARRLRGPPAPPVHARLAGRGDRRLLPRGRRAAAARRPATTSAPSSRCWRSRTGRLEPVAARADAQPAAPPRRVAAQAGGVARGLPRGRAARARPRARPRRQARVPARARRAALGAAQPGRARPHPPRLRRRRRQRQPRALVGEVRPPLAGRGRSASCSTPTRGSTCPVLLLWADEDPAHPLAAAAGGARPAPGRAAADAARHRLPDRLRRPGRASRAS